MSKPKIGDRLSYGDTSGIVKAVTNQFLIFDNSLNGDYNEYALVVDRGEELYKYIEPTPNIEGIEMMMLSVDNSSLLWKERKRVLKEMKHVREDIKNLDKAVKKNKP